MTPSGQSHLLARMSYLVKTQHLALGVALIIMAWVAVCLQVRAEHQAMVRTLVHDTSNLAMVFEQSVERTASEIDRIIRYLRASYERNGHKADWPALVQEEFTANNQTVQIAIIAPDGMMITSSKMLYPQERVDLSDREHYRVHVGEYRDRLFISKPVLGRASNTWSVQFTRPFKDDKGKFAGVIVVSLDPKFLTNSYSGLQLGRHGGVALAGSDGIVLAAAGIFDGLLGKALPPDETGIELAEEVAQDEVKLIQSVDGPIASIRRQTTGFPLSVTFRRAGVELNETRLKNARNYVIGAIALSLIVLLTIGFSLRSRHFYESRLTHLAKYDNLTQVLNRREFEAVLDCAVNAGDATPFSVHMVDLDLFKEVNDTYGHHVGDKVLVEVGHRLRRNLRAHDVVARLGGDEFGIIQIGSTGNESAGSLADRLCNEIAEPIVIDGCRIEIGASIGIVPNGLDFADQAELVRSADLALYHVKSSNRGGWSMYEPRMNEEARTRREIEVGLRVALAEGHLRVHYQPINSVTTGEITGYEALVRWMHPERGLIPPIEFIPIAEATGLIVELGAWVLHEACREIAMRSQTLRIAVNVSAIEFRSSDVVASVRHALEVSGLPAERLEIEITESLLIERGGSTIDQLKALRDMGVKIAIDDFGTGYSSLSYLQVFPIDCVKIDRSFVSRLGDEENANAIVHAISSLASCLGMSTTAEGVETAEQLSHLARMGCTEAQGYLFSPPRPASEILPSIVSETKELRLVA